MIMFLSFLCTNSNKNLDSYKCQDLEISTKIIFFVKNLDTRYISENA